MPGTGAIRAFHSYRVSIASPSSTVSVFGNLRHHGIAFHAKRAVVQVVNSVIDASTRKRTVPQ
jgi:hypothetical protein